MGPPAFSYFRNSSSVTMISVSIAVLSPDLSWCPGQQSRLGNARKLFQLFLDVQCHRSLFLGKIIFLQLRCKALKLSPHFSLSIFDCARNPADKNGYMFPKLLPLCFSTWKILKPLPVIPNKTVME